MNSQSISDYISEEHNIATAKFLETLINIPVIREHCATIPALANYVHQISRNPLLRKKVKEPSRRTLLDKYEITGKFSHEEVESLCNQMRLPVESVFMGTPETGSYLLNFHTFTTEMCTTWIGMMEIKW